MLCRPRASASASPPGEAASRAESFSLIFLGIRSSVSVLEVFVEVGVCVWGSVHVCQLPIGL